MCGCVIASAPLSPTTASASDGLQLIEKLKARSAEQSWREMREQQKQVRKQERDKRKSSRAGQQSSQNQTAPETSGAEKQELPKAPAVSPPISQASPKQAPVQQKRTPAPALMPQIGEGSPIPEPLFGVDPKPAPLPVKTVSAPENLTLPQTDDQQTEYEKHEAELDAFIDQMRRRREQRYSAQPQVGGTIFGEVFQLEQSGTKATNVSSQPGIKPYVESDVTITQQPTPMPARAVPKHNNSGSLSRGQQDHKLKPINHIMPFHDYEPDPELAAKDPCRNLCPRPDGLPCDSANGAVPACPTVASIGEEEFSERAFAFTDFNWCAPNFSYMPLYFEDADLERSMNSRGPIAQPVASVSRFSLQLVSLPYQWVLHPIHEEIYPLGHMRPGECKPGQIDAIPLNAKAALHATQFYTGFFYIFP